MKTKKTITAICAGLMALASASTSMAETKADYIKTFGMIMFERNGLLELEFTPEEFDAFVAGMKAVNESKKLPDDIQATGAKAFEFLRARAEANAAKAAEKATAQAKRNLIAVPMVGASIPHEVDGKFGRGHVHMLPAPEGTGVIAGGPVRAIMECAGIKDIRTKSHGTSNPINCVKATIAGLADLKTAEQVAALRGKPVEEILG